MNKEILMNEIVDELKTIIEPEYAEEIATNIVDEVAEDIEETADKAYNSSDVRYAIGRVLVKLLRNG